MSETHVGGGGVGRMSGVECLGRCASLTESGAGYIDPDCPKHGTRSAHCRCETIHSPQMEYVPGPHHEVGCDLRREVEDATPSGI